MNTKNYRRLLKEIIDGHSPCLLGDKTRYLKHQTISGVVDFELVYDQHYNRAQDRGLPTEKEVLASLRDEEVWSTKDEAEIENQTFYLESLIRNKKNLYLKSAIRQINKQIGEAEENVNKLLRQKQELTANCCERYALNRANDFYMFSSFFCDRALKDPLYDQEEFERVEAAEVIQLVDIYNRFHAKFSEDNIQNLVLQDFYRIYHSFSESCVDFYGEPIVKLSNNQMNLIIYTRIFKNIFETHEDIPEKIRKDPQSLLDFANSSEAREDIKRKMSEKEGGGGTSIVGATAEDLEELGMTPAVGAKSIEQATKDKGGQLSMKDLMDLSGV